MGAQGNKRQTFSFAAPNAQQVLVAGEFTGWQPVPLKRGADGIWKTTILLEPGKHEYRFLVDGQWCDDPNCVSRVANGFGSDNCICFVEFPPDKGKRLAV